MGANTSHEPLKGGDVSGGRKFPNGTATGIRPYVRSSIRKSLRRRKGKHKSKNNQDGEVDTQTKGPSEAHSRTMDKLKRTLSLKKKKEQHIPESSKPHIWQTDEASVRQGTCSFSVKYLGCVEVFESRGMQVCEEALRVLRQNSRRRPVRGILYVSGDGLRVVDDDTKGLLVDQTIEKVSFCAPDRQHERGFSYICRDGTTRRWMCHGFIAAKESQGERLSHAVGCAFAVCLERKQRRDQDSGVTMSFDQTTSTFTRMGSFKQVSMTERLSDPQECKPMEYPLPVKKVDNPHAIARPHATPQLLQRQGSFRVFSHLNQSSPFKRQLSLRINDLPSNVERTRSMSLDSTSSVENAANLLNNNSNNAIVVPPIPETSVLVEPAPQDAVSAMCQQVSAGLSLLSSFQDSFSSSNPDPVLEGTDNTNLESPPVKDLLESGINWSASNQSDNSEGYMNEMNSVNLSKGEEWLAQLHSGPAIPEPRSIGVHPPQRRNPMLQYRSASLGAAPPSTFSPIIHSHPTTNGAADAPKTTSDPFDADWAALASKAANPNNPFIQHTTTKTFEVHM